MVNDFLDNLGAQQYEKLIKANARKEEDYYNSQSEGKEYDQEEDSTTWRTSSIFIIPLSFRI